MEDCKEESMYLDLLEQCRDPEVFIHTMMRWHFSKETGAEFWLRFADELDFDPVKAVKTFRDLKKFPDISARLRTVRAETLIPRGLTGLMPSVYESGGTTGSPKFFIAYEEWIKRLAKWFVAPHRYLHGNTLAAVPAGPHIVGAITRMKAHYMGGLCFTIDLDPRWVRLSIHEGYAAEAERYTAHIMKQIQRIIAVQPIKCMVITPPLLRAIAKEDSIIEKLRQNMACIMMGGTQVNLDEVQLIAESFLPDCAFRSIYGSTSKLGACRSQLITADTEQVIYESFSPFITYDIVDPETLESVDVGSRGRVVASHLSPYAFYPQVFERDMGTKLPPAPGMFGACVADIVSDRISGGAELIEGVY